MIKYQDFARRLITPGTVVREPLITVYYAGADPGDPASLAAIYADDNADPTPLDNPFTGDASSYFYFYAPPGHYDIQFSGGLPAINPPYTLGDVELVDLGIELLNLRRFGGRPGASFNDLAMTDALQYIQEQQTLGLIGGATIYTGGGRWKFQDLIPCDLQHVNFLGNALNETEWLCEGEGGLLLSDSYCSVKNLYVHMTGTNAYGIKLDPDSVVPGEGVFAPIMRDVKINGEVGTGNGLWLVNCTRGYFDGMSVPGCGGDGIVLQGSGFHTFNYPKVQVNTGESLASAVNGILLEKQPGNDVLQSDDNKFFHSLIEGVSGNGIYIRSIIDVFFVPPARNGFHGGTSEGNGAANVALENSLANHFYDFHSEIAPKGFWILGNNGNHVNTFTNCSGNLDIDDPSLPQGIQGNGIVNHIGTILITGPNVYGTRIMGCSTEPTDNGTDTSYDVTVLAASGSSISVRYYGGRRTGAPAASIQTVQVSGGVFVNLCALPDNKSGYVLVTSRQNNFTNQASYLVGYTTGSPNAAISAAPIALAVVGADSAQLTFQISAGPGPFFLQCRGANAATAPDVVKAAVDSLPA